ncbi:MAG: rod-binding protein [Desulfovibrionales bacterium]|nr:rod-binding protein [Desulfovibrionales bacterium]
MDKLSGPVGSIQAQQGQNHLNRMNQIKHRLTGMEKKAPDPEKEKELMDACAGFEAVFMEKMLSSMRETLPGNALFQESNSMDIYQSLHDQYLCDQLSQAPQAMGIKEFLFNQLKNAL